MYNSLKVNAQNFTLFRNQLLVFKRVHVEVFYENVSLIRCCVLLRDFFILAILRITRRSFVFVTLRKIWCSRFFVDVVWRSHWVVFCKILRSHMMRSSIVDEIVCFFLFDFSNFELLCKLLWTFDNRNVRLRHTFLKLRVLLFEDRLRTISTASWDSNSTRSLQIHFFEIVWETLDQSDSVFSRVFAYGQRLIQIKHYVFLQNVSRSWCRSSIFLFYFQIAESNDAAIDKLWSEKSDLDLHFLWSTRSLMKMKALCIVRFLFFAFFLFESTMIDAILFSINAHFFVSESERSIFERDVLKRSVKRSSVFRSTYRQSFSSRVFAWA